jgi:DDE superfamily endonuclease
MMLLVDFPSIVKKYAPVFEPYFSAEGYEHFKRAISGFIVSDNKTLEAINRMFVRHTGDQSCFNKFFNRQNFDLEAVNCARLDMLHSNAGTCFKEKGVLSVDNSLLKHYGRHFDNIYYHYDYVHKCYRWAHDLVTLHYSDDHTDYPVHHKLWEPPDWDAVATFFMGKGFTINEQKWACRAREPQKWRNYIRARYKEGRKEYPGVVEIYKTKNHIALELLRKFCAQYPQWHFPVALDTGFTSAELCGAICGELKRDYVGALREDQYITADGKETSLKDFLQKLRQGHAGPKEPVFQKTSYSFKGGQQVCYAYFANHHVRGFDKKQRLVISFLNEDLSDRPSFTVTNRLDWYPSGILRIRRHRWPVETYHQEGKAEGLEEYQVRNGKAIQTYIAFIVVAYSMLKCTAHDADLLSSIQQRLQTGTDGTLPFLRRLMKAEGLLLLLEFILAMQEQGQSLEQIFQALAPNIAYT